MLEHPWLTFVGYIAALFVIADISTAFARRNRP